MWQRIQSLYLFLAILCLGFLPYILSVSGTTDPLLLLDWGLTWVKGVFAVSALLSAYSLFSFKNRKRQFVINRIVMLLQLVLLGYFVYLSLTSSEKKTFFQEDFAMLIPIFSIFLLAMANRAIMKDERLVRAADRLR